jgi:peptidoglycan/LPS O-acetylase OafA/YrhL
MSNTTTSGSGQESIRRAAKITDRWTLLSQAVGYGSGQRMGEAVRGDRVMYMPGLDGLRAYLMLTVLLFHIKVPGFSGGWISVDVFFALSGVLITRNLVNELDATGTVSLGSFWSRRSRRLLPALVGFLAVSVMLVAAGVLDLRPSAAWGALTYTTNWVHILVPGNGYWDAFAAPDPFEHLWSLAVEEQFYLVWPLVVLALRRRGRRAVGVAAGVMALGSVATQVIGSNAGWSIDRLYQGTDTRAVPFLLGSLIACLGIPRLGRITGATVTVCSVAILAWATHTLDGSEVSVYRGPLQIVSVAGVLVVMAAAHSRHTVMCHPSVRAIGRWSYGIYLFHWPLAVAMPDNWSWFWRLVVVATGSTLLAAFSYRWIEAPVRSGALRGRQLIPTTVAVAGIAAAAVIVAAPISPSTMIARAEQSVDWSDVAMAAASAPTDTKTDDTVAPSSATEFNGTPVANTSDSDNPANDQASPALPDLALPGTPRRVLVLGDSTANVLAHGLEATGRFDIVDGGMWGCPIVEATRVRPARTTERSVEYCPGLAEQIAAIELVAPDVVVVIASATEVWDHTYAEDGDWTTPGDPLWQLAHDRHLRALVDAHPGRPIVIVPAPDWRPPSSDALETAERRDAWNAQIDRWVTEHEQTSTMGYVSYLPAVGSAEDREMRPDGAHLTEDWIARLARDHLADELVTAYRAILTRTSAPS